LEFTSTCNATYICMHKAIELKTSCERKVMKHKQLGEQGELHNSHCEANIVHTALHVFY